MAEYKTPGVYVVEKNAFPNSVVEVATAVPAFIGCTETAMRGVVPLTGIPTRITSLSEYNKLFGYAPPLEFAFSVNDGDATKPPFKVSIEDSKRFYFYNSLRMFFANGGGPCYIVSVDSFKARLAAGGVKAMTQKALVTDPLSALLKYPEPTMIVIPDMVLLPQASWQGGTADIISHCVKMQSRIGIFDVYGVGDLGPDQDSNALVEAFRDQVAAEGDQLNYGVAYYPWLNASIVEASDIDFSNFGDTALGALVTYLQAQAKNSISDDAKLKKVNELLGELTTAAADAKTTPRSSKVQSKHMALKTVLPAYQDVLDAMLLAANVLPPSGGMAGVYTRIDNNMGVFKAPANVPIHGAISPTLEITHDEQEDLNVPLDGKALNAIRTFPGRGMLVWGARTLDGNSQDWRYVSVRRTMIMLEQSIKIAVETYMFAANNAQTWVTVKSMIINFLTNKWKEGALQGSSAEEAFSVDVGLGSTMDANDILDGYMRVLVKVAVVHPAEFIVITFQQQMAKS